MNQEESLSIAIVEAIADAEGVEPLNLNFSLEEYVDTDALDAFGRQFDTEWRLQLTVAGHIVTADSERGVTVDEDAYRGVNGQRLTVE